MNFVDKCGQTHDSSTGLTSIMSPNFPHKYANNIDCEYTVVSTNGKNITMSIEVVQLEEGGEACTKDYVEVKSYM